MRFYEDPQKTSENRLPQRAYYIPQNEGAHLSLNGTWRFRYYPGSIFFFSSTSSTSQARRTCIRVLIR